MGPNQAYDVWHSKGNLEKKRRDNCLNGRKLVANGLIHKTWISKVYKHFIHLNIKTLATEFKNGQKISIGISLESIYTWPKSTGLNAQHQ